MRLLALTLVGLTLGACADLRDLEADGTCGNDILEPKSGEDCDGFALADELACGAAGTGGACRYVCSPIAASAQCPDGWACGVDGVCRAAAETFTATADVVPVPITRLRDLHIGDIDGDRRSDVVALVGPDVRVRFGDRLGMFDREVLLTVGTPLGDLLLADLDPDGRTDVIVPQIPGPLIARGRADGSLDPVAYGTPTSSPGFVGRPGYRMVTVRSDVRALETPMTIEPTATRQLRVRFPRADATTNAPGVFNDVQVEFSLADIIAVESAVTGASINGAGRDRVALSFQNGNAIYVLSTVCTRTALALSCGVVSVETVDVAPGAVVIYGAHFADVDGDGLVDLIGLSAADESAGAQMVGFGRGDGGFCPTKTPCARSGMRRVRFQIPDGTQLLLTGQLLAVGDVDGDRFSDYVFAEGIVGITQTSSAGGNTTVRALPLAQPRAQATWSAAVIGDFNRDGIADVATTYEQENGVEFLIGTPERFFNRVRVATNAAPDSVIGLIRGDFDGDLFDDIALAQIDGDVVVMFGDPTGAPKETVRMGRFFAINSIAAGDLAIRGETNQDLVSDLLVVSTSTINIQNIDPPLLVTELIGTGERRMVAPLTFRTEDGESGLPLAVSSGPFGVSSDELPDLLALSIRGGIEFGQTRDQSLWIAQADGDGTVFPTSSMGRADLNGPCALSCPGNAFIRRVTGRQIVIVEQSTECALRPSGQPPSLEPLVVDFEWMSGQLVRDCHRLPSIEVATDRIPTRIEEVFTADVDGDGQLDLLIHQPFDSTRDDFGPDFGGRPAIAYFGPLESSSRPVTLSPASSFGIFARAMDLRDLDGDGRAEMILIDLQGVAIANIARDGTYSVTLRIEDSGTLLDGEGSAGPFDGRLDEFAVRTLDANGDGLLDILAIKNGRARVLLRAVCTADEASSGRCARYEPGVAP